MFRKKNEFINFFKMATFIKLCRWQILTIKHVLKKYCKTIYLEVRKLSENINSRYLFLKYRIFGLNHVWILSTFTSIRRALLNLDLILSKPCMAKSQQSDNEMKSLLTNCLVSEAKIVCSVTFVQMLVIRQDEIVLQLHPVRDCINLHLL